jgi:hypothetical protein
MMTLNGTTTGSVCADDTDASSIAAMIDSNGRFNIGSSRKPQRTRSVAFVSRGRSS